MRGNKQLLGRMHQRIDQRLGDLGVNAVFDFIKQHKLIGAKLLGQNSQ